MIIETTDEDRVLIQRYGQCYRILGITQMSAGFVCLLMEIIATFVRISISGVGIWVGLLFIISGIISYITPLKRTRKLVAACLSMSIMAAIVALLPGIAVSSFDISSIIRGRQFIPTRSVNRTEEFGLAKTSVIIILCVLEGISAIITACLSCVHFCPCYVVHHNEVRIHTIHDPFLPTMITTGNGLSPLPHLFAPPPYHALNFDSDYNTPVASRLDIDINKVYDYDFPPSYNAAVSVRGIDNNKPTVDT